MLSALSSLHDERKRPSQGHPQRQVVKSKTLCSSPETVNKSDLRCASAFPSFRISELVLMVLFCNEARCLAGVVAEYVVFPNAKETSFTHSLCVHWHLDMGNVPRGLVSPLYTAIARSKI